MTTPVKFSFKTILIGFLTLAVIVFGAINFKERAKAGRWVNLDDGVSWLDTERGVEAMLMDADGPGDRAGIKKGDLLVSIDGRRMTRAVEVTRQLFRTPAWTKATYQLQRAGVTIETKVIVAPEGARANTKYYLSLVGVLYLLIGVFIFARRWHAPQAFLFFLFCGMSFILYFYSPTGKLNSFDWIIYWANSAALLLQPPLFLHFCLAFPQYKPSLERRKYLLTALYLPALFLLALQICFVAGTWIFYSPTLYTRWFLDRLQIFYLAVFFVLGSISLLDTKRRARAPELKQQMMWITTGAFAAVVPFASIYAIPYFLGVVPTPMMELAVLPLIFIPLTFGYAIVRFRLMDVDIIFKRASAYTIATVFVVGLYFGVAALVGTLLGKIVPGASTAASVVATVIAMFLFAPMRDWVQVRLDKFFYRERYDYRRTLVEFSRELSSEVHMDKMIDSVIDRLSQTLLVDRLAVFVEEESAPGQFRLARSRGLNVADALELGFLTPGVLRLNKYGYLFFQDFKSLFTVPRAFQGTVRALDLNYYLPCVVQEKTIAYLGLSKTIRGDFLSSEDMELLQAVAGYVGIAIENGRLYQSIEQKALAYQRLKDFNENIVESINVGVLSVDLEDRIESWNRPMEQLYGVTREQAIGRKLSMVFPSELVSLIEGIGSDEGFATPSMPSIYKYKLKNRREEHLMVSISVVPLLGRDWAVKGKLVIFDDITQRVALEEQLMQSEKLTSIGLLAAGVAHEVNTPLTVISSYTQMLMKQLRPDDPKVNIVDKIVKQSFRASEIVNSLLNFSRTTGTELREIDCNQVLRETLSLLDHQFKTARIHVEAKLADSVPPIFGNSGKLQQVFLNLFLNAKDAMPNGGQLRVETNERNSSVRIAISDTGAGIAREHLKKIYDPFFTTKTGRGTGLGLSVSYGIIQEHSGTIDVESALGQGTRFTLEFPAVRKAVSV